MNTRRTRGPHWQCALVRRPRERPRKRNRLQGLSLLSQGLPEG